MEKLPFNIYNRVRFELLHATIKTYVLFLCICKDRNKGKSSLLGSKIPFPLKLKKMS